MTRRTKLFLFVLFALGTFGAGRETRLILRQRAEIESLEKKRATLLEQTAAARRERDAAKEEQEITAAVLAEAKARTLAAAPAEAWRARVQRLKQLLDAQPEQKIPELKLLDPKDWIEIALKPGFLIEDQGDNPWKDLLALNQRDPTNPIRTAFSELRKKARGKFVRLLQEALEKYLAVSGKKLPADISQLAAYLAAPGDDEMLRRYKMTRQGKAGLPSEMVITEQASPDEVLDGLVVLGTNRAEFHPTGSAPEKAEELGNAMGRALEPDMNKLAEAMESVIGEHGSNINPSIKEFSSAHDGRMPANLLELQPYLKNFDAVKIAAALRPVIAATKFAVVHHGTFATDPSQLRPYLETPLDVDEALRAIKIDDDGRSIAFKFGGE